VKDRREIIVFASRKTKKLRNYDAKSAPMDKALGPSSDLDETKVQLQKKCQGQATTLFH
jgi:hypothetical protein